VIATRSTIGLSRASVNVVRSPHRRMTSAYGECAPHGPDWAKSAANGTVGDSIPAKRHNIFPECHLEPG
jgi:hypothetical protein